MDRLLSVARVIFPDGSRLERAQVHINNRGKIVDIATGTAVTGSTPTDEYNGDVARLRLLTV